jgi:hypothetical protein
MVGSVWRSALLAHKFVRSGRASLVEFDTEKSESGILLFKCHRTSIPQTQVSIDGSNYTFTFHDSHCTIDTAGIVWSMQRRLRLALSMLLGTRAQIFAARESNKLYLNLAKDVDYQRAHPLFESPQLAPSMLECLTRFLISLSDRDFNHWYKASAFMIEGKSSYAELEIRVTNLFVFLEMFDAAETLSGNAISAMLEIPLSDAKLLCGVRNKLVHERHTLREAIAACDAELSKYNPHHTLHAFNATEPSAPTTFYLRLCERINRFIARTIGWSGKHYAYRDNLTHYPPP